MEKSASSSKCRTFKVSDTFPRGQERETCKKVIRSDLKERKVSKAIAKDRSSWIRKCPTHGSTENKG